MQASNANQNFSSGDSEWVLLGELRFSDFLSDQDRRDESTAGSLFQTMQELGVQLECQANIARLVTEFAKGSPVHYKDEGLKFPSRIRVLCQKKIIDDANAAKTSRAYYTGQTMKDAQAFPDPGANRIGGWGYFSIERGSNVSAGSSGSAGNSVDVYLYKEGE